MILLINHVMEKCINLADDVIEVETRPFWVLPGNEVAYKIHTKLKIVKIWFFHVIGKCLILADFFLREIKEAYRIQSRRSQDLVFHVIEKCLNLAD